MNDDSIVKASSLFDFSNYPSNHPCFSKDNKKVPGKMKDELGGNILLEFIGLCPKAYAFKKLILYGNEDGDEKEGEIIEVKKLKSIQKYEVRRNIHCDDSKYTVFEEKTHYATNVTLLSHLREIRTVRIHKVAMTPYDDKRYLLDDGVISLPFGYK